MDRAQLGVWCVTYLGLGHAGGGLTRSSRHRVIDDDERQWPMVAFGCTPWWDMLLRGWSLCWLGMGLCACVQVVDCCPVGGRGRMSLSPCHASRR